MELYSFVKLGELITPAKNVRCGTGNYPVLSMTMRDGLVFQENKFKKVIASKDTSDYKVVYRNQLVVSFPIDEGVLATQRITDAGIVSPAYAIWDINQDRMLPEFLEYALRCERALSYYRGKLRGSTARRRSLPTPTLLELSVPLPRIKEQERVLTIVNKSKELISLRKKQLQKLDELVKAGFVEMFGDVIDNPFGFDKKMLKETCTIITGNTPSRLVSEYYGDGVEWIKTDNIVEGQIKPSQAIEYLTEKGVKVGRTVDKGAILMACIAGSVASIGRVCIADRKVAFNQQINAVVPKAYDSLFLYVMLQQSKNYLVEEINMALKGILSKSKLESKVFFVPPMDRQKEFTAFVTQCEKSKAVVQKALDEAQLLFDSLMQKYFG